MGVGLLITILIVLVLALTGMIGPVLVFSVKLGGWIVVAVIVVALIWKLISRLLRPMTDWFARHSAESEIQGRIKKRQALGYDTSDLEEELSKLRQDLERARGSANATVEEERRRLGYTDKAQ